MDVQLASSTTQSTAAALFLAVKQLRSSSSKSELNSVEASIASHSPDSRDYRNKVSKSRCKCRNIQLRCPVVSIIYGLNAKCTYLHSSLFDA
jgi:hypothetical protein